MLEITYHQEQELYWTEVVDSQLKDQKIPLVVFYHGWTGDKDQVILYGVELAKRGLRAILPEQKFHGLRAEGRLKGYELWPIIFDNIQQLPLLLDVYRQKILLDDQSIAVAGYSMGGITTYALLATFPWIKTAASLMGNPDPLRFTDWVMTSSWMEGVEDTSLIEQSLKDLLPSLKEISLAAHPEKIANRHLLIWHGTTDKRVPYEMNRQFYEEIQDQVYAKQVTWLETEGVGHVVPFEIALETADYLKKQLG